MATITNNKPRLLWGVKTPGYRTPQWTPGKNPLDPEYWDKIKNHATIQKWLELEFISVDLHDNSADPMKPPTQDQLEGFTPTELKAALKDPDVPVTWHSHLQAELKRRKLADTNKPVEPPAPKPAPSKPSKPGLTGMKVEEALPLIAVETDVDKLISWADADKRKTIGEAVDARLAELEPEDEE